MDVNCFHLNIMTILRWRDINCFHLLVDGGFCSAANNGVLWWQLWRYVFILLAYVILEGSIHIKASVWRCSWNVATKLRD